MSEGNYKDRFLIAIDHLKLALDDAEDIMEKKGFDRGLKYKTELCKIDCIPRKEHEAFKQKVVDSIDKMVDRVSELGRFDKATFFQCMGFIRGKVEEKEVRK